MNIRQLVKKGRVVDPRSIQAYIEHPNGARRFTVDGVIRDAMDRTRILVNIQSVINDLYAMPAVAGEWTLQALIDEVASPKAPPTPPYRKMWIEGKVDGQTQRATPMAMSVERFDLGGRFAVGAVVWGITSSCSASCLGVVGYTVEEDGRVDPSSVVFDQMMHRPKYSQYEEVGLLAWNCALLAHTMARLNCRNITLRPMNEPKCAPHHQRDLVPATVWHEIKITDTPRIQTTGRGIFGRDESKERRHWVRGHYADYRNGAGLFGNPNLRCVFWIPEHQRGNPALGDVIPEYTLA